MTSQPSQENIHQRLVDSEHNPIATQQQLLSNTNLEVDYKSHLEPVFQDGNSNGGVQDGQHHSRPRNLSNSYQNGKVLLNKNMH